MKILNLFGWISVWGFLAAACQNGETETGNDATAKEQEVYNTDADGSPYIKAYCFYKLDEKYSDENDTLLLHNWLTEKSGSVLSGTPEHNIFNESGGGPNGAEWNPSTDLYIAIVSAPGVKANKPELLINDQTYSNRVMSASQGLEWHIIKRDLWEKIARPIDSADIEKMYDQALLNSLKSHKVKPIAPLTYGEVLKFTIRHGNYEIIKYFHATYGE